MPDPRISSTDFVEQFTQNPGQPIPLRAPPPAPAPPSGGLNWLLELFGVTPAQGAELAPSPNPGPRNIVPSLTPQQPENFTFGGPGDDAADALYKFITGNPELQGGAPAPSVTGQREIINPVPRGTEYRPPQSVMPDPPVPPGPPAQTDAGVPVRQVQPLTPTAAGSLAAPPPQPKPAVPDHGPQSAVDLLFNVITALTADRPQPPAQGQIEAMLNPGAANPMGQIEQMLFGDQSAVEQGSADYTDPVIGRAGNPIQANAEANIEANPTSFMPPVEPRRDFPAPAPQPQPQPSFGGNNNESYFGGISSYGGSPPPEPFIPNFGPTGNARNDGIVRRANSGGGAAAGAPSPVTTSVRDTAPSRGSLGGTAGLGSKRGFFSTTQTVPKVTDAPAPKKKPAAPAPKKAAPKKQAPKPSLTQTVAPSPGPARGTAGNPIPYQDVSTSDSPGSYITTPAGYNLRTMGTGGGQSITAAGNPNQAAIGVRTPAQVRAGWHPSQQQPSYGGGGGSSGGK